MNFLDEQKRNVRTTWLIVTAFFTTLAGFGLFLDLIFFNLTPYITSVVCIVAGVLAYNAHKDGAALMLRSVQAKLLDPAQSLKHRQVHNIAIELALASGLPRPRLYVEPDDAINAFAAGKNSDDAIICVTDALIERLDRNEITAVMAHQLGVIRSGDVFLHTILASCVGAFGLLSALAWSGASENFPDRNDFKGGILGRVLLAFVAGVLWVAAWAGTLIRLLVRQTRAFHADAVAIEFSREPEGLIEALRKINIEGIDTEHGHVEMAHAYFVQPSFRSFVLIKTHPPIEERIQRLGQRRANPVTMAV